MQRGKKIAAALIMLGLGFGTALLFRRADSPETSAPPSDSAPQKEALVLRESGGHHPHPTKGSQLGPVPLKPSKTTTPPKDLSEPIIAPQTPSAPPELPTRFDRSLTGFADTLRDTSSDLARLERYSPSSPLSTVPQGTPPLRVHRVVDGDTLGRLAERFLGDAKRHSEIHALNQDQVSDPNVLPIGLELKIPPRDGTLALRPVSPSTDFASPVSSDTPDYSPVGISPPSDTGLVPVTVGKPHP